MVLFGQHPSQGTLLKASQFLVGELSSGYHWLTSLYNVKCLSICIDELPVRLAHRVKELDELPHNLSEMSSIRKVKNWYAQSFEVGRRNRLIHELSTSDFHCIFLWTSPCLSQVTHILGIDRFPPAAIVSYRAPITVFPFRQGR